MIKKPLPLWTAFAVAGTTMASYRLINGQLEVVTERIATNDSDSEPVTKVPPGVVVIGSPQITVNRFNKAEFKWLDISVPEHTTVITRSIWRTK